MSDVDWIINGDDSRFVNHSYTPNTKCIGPSSLAIRDINIGDELTIDYRDLCSIEEFLALEQKLR